MTTTRIETELVVRLGSIERRADIARLAGALGIDEAMLRRVLLRLVVHPQPVDADHHESGKRGTTGGDGRSTRSGSNERASINDFPIGRIDDRRSDVRETLVAGDGGSREEEGDPGRDTNAHSSPERIGAYLAERLRDPSRLALYELVAREVPRSVIHDALTAALDLAPDAVRRSRAAYFTAIVRPYLRGRGHSPPYARTSAHPA